MRTRMMTKSTSSPGRARRVATVGRFVPTHNADGSPDVIIRAPTAAHLGVVKASVEADADRRGCVVEWELSPDGLELRGTTKPMAVS
jgi:hypothetical protein